MLTRFPRVRWRTTAVPTLVVAALVFALAQRQQLQQPQQLQQGSITEAAPQQATDIAVQVARDGAGTDSLPGDQSLVQIVDADGNVSRPSPSVVGRWWTPDQTLGSLPHWSREPRSCPSHASNRFIRRFRPVRADGGSAHPMRRPGGARFRSANRTMSPSSVRIRPATTGDDAVDVHQSRVADEDEGLQLGRSPLMFASTATRRRVPRQGIRRRISRRCHGMTLARRTSASDSARYPRVYSAGAMFWLRWKRLVGS
jgi:hypothetical protein